MEESNPFLVFKSYHNSLFTICFNHKYFEMTCVIKHKKHPTPFCQESHHAIPSYCTQCICWVAISAFVHLYLSRPNTGLHSWRSWFYDFCFPGALICMMFTQSQFWPSGIVVACVCVCVCQSVRQSLVCPRDNSRPVQPRIAKFGPKVQNNLVKVAIVLWSNRPWPSRSNIRSKSKFTPFWACTHHNTSPIQTRITKFGPEVQNTLVKIPTV